MRDETKKDDTLTVTTFDATEIKGVGIRSKLACHKDGEPCLGCSTLYLDFMAGESVYVFELKAPMAGEVYNRLHDAVEALIESYKKAGGKDDGLEG